MDRHTGKHHYTWLIVVLYVLLYQAVLELEYLWINLQKKKTQNTADPVCVCALLHFLSGEDVYKLVSLKTQKGCSNG